MNNVKSRLSKPRARIAISLYVALVAVSCATVLLSCATASFAQSRMADGSARRDFSRDGHRDGGFSRSGREWRGHGGWSGGSSSFAGSFVPSIVADVLLVPSLTKAQQAKVRALYVAYRTKAREKMEVMGKLRGDYNRGAIGEEPKKLEDTARNSGGVTRNGLGVSKNDGSVSANGSSKTGDGARKGDDRRKSDAQASMDSSTDNLRRTLFMSMFKESERFHRDLLAILDEKQKAELKEIASKAGSPDYFKDLHYDKMNAVKSPAQAKDKPD